MTTALPETFTTAFDTAQQFLAIYHLQGYVAAGFDKNETPGFEGQFIPKYKAVLGNKDYKDTGGQSANVGEREYFAGVHGIPAIMFAMSKDRDSTEPMVVPHNRPENGGNTFIVYLPFSLFKEAGIEDSEIEPNGLVAKEVTMKHRETLYPLIAQASVNFMKEHIPDFKHKNVALDANYIDAGQTVIHAQELLKNDSEYKGKDVSVWTPHTLGIDKCASLLEDFLKTMDAKLESLALPSESFSQLNAHPYLTNQRKILSAARQHDDSQEVAQKIAHVMQYREENLTDFMQRLENAGVSAEATAEITAYAKKNDVTARSEKFSFVDRLTMEGGANLEHFDAIMSVSAEAVPQLKKWTDNKIPVGFSRNGFDGNIYNPTIFSQNPNISEQDILDSAKQLLAEAHEFNGKKLDVSDEQLCGTTFISVCRPDERKGSDLAIKAFAEWAKAHPDDMGSLVLVAHKPEKDNPSDYQQTLLNLIDQLDKDDTSLHLKERIFLLPSQRADQTRTLYELPCAVGLAPSLNEPWGIVAVEQGGAGIPVIGSNKYASAVHMEHSMPEDRKSIVLFNSGDEHDFAKQMGEVSQNYTKYNDAALANASAIHQEFPWEATATQYENLYKKLQTIIPPHEIGEKTIIFSDVDGCITQNIKDTERTQHEDYERLTWQIQNMQKAGGVSVIATGRSMAGILSDPLLENYPADFVISGVGTEIHERVGSGYVKMDSYETYLSTPPEGKEAFDKQQAETQLVGLEIQGVVMTPQPTKKVSQRLGYYVENKEGVTKDAIIAAVQEALGNAMDVQVVPSLDPHHSNWNVDVMSSKANKKGAADFLIEELKQRGKNFGTAMAWGDSGNDIPMFDPALYTSHGITSVALIAPSNATQEVRDHFAGVQTSDQIKTYLADAPKAVNDDDPAWIREPAQRQAFHAGGTGDILNGMQEALQALAPRKQAVKGTPDSTEVTNVSLNGKAAEKTELVFPTPAASWR
jgi:glycosyltransferase involved in cell wall biosynthesis/hydroxymethylpyrimidine pyrophosphatase-like HAD family hydrolase